MLGTKWLPFADVANEELPFSRLLRLSLFQLSVGLVQTLFAGTLNRVMIVELAVPASVVAIMLAIPLLVAPLRALVGFKSDTHRSLLGWKRVPFLWGGTMLQFAGLSMMPFALLVLSDGPRAGPAWTGHLGTAIAFLLVGAGAHTTQTAGLALATDIVSEDKRPRVIALMYLMMLLGTLFSALCLEWLLRDFSAMKLIQVIQGTAVATGTMATGSSASTTSAGANTRADAAATRHSSTITTNAAGRCERSVMPWSWGMSSQRDGWSTSWESGSTAS